MAGLPTLAPGTLFARDFQVIGLLAEGGMGAVYVVEQVSTGKRRALKIMLPQLVEDRRARERFAMEARIGSQIESEHIVEVVGAGVDEATQTPWLAMEMLEGQDLAQMMRIRGRLPVDETIEMLQQLAEGLGPAHHKGIVHRDLKPENLFIAISRRRGVPFTLKILDFGIAKLTQESRATASATAAIGSPMWMSPEQTEQTAQLRPATDVWAIGLITFYMLTGRYYWRVANEPEVRLTALFTEVLVTPLDPPSVRAAQAGLSHLIPAGFDLWFSRCVAREPTQRFADAAAAIAAIGPGFTVRDPSGPISLPPTLDPRRGLVAPTMPMQVVSRDAPYAAHPSQPPMAIQASRPVNPYATSTPYSVQGPSTATAPVPPRSGAGLGRTIALVAGLFLLGAGGAAATLGALVFYEHYEEEQQRTVSGGDTTETTTDPETTDADAGAAIEADAGVDAEIPHGEDPTELAQATDTTPHEADPHVHHAHDHGHVLPATTVPPTTETETSSGDGSGAGYAWPDGTSLAFNGTYSSSGFRYAMTFNLQRTGGSVRGSIFVVCEAAPDDQTSLVGRSAMEWVSGTYASSGALVLTGSNSTDESVWTTGTYRLTVNASGGVSGRATDGGRITGHV
jgi:serine/threonine protein kinase